MAKKINASFEAEMRKNTEKGGAWLVEFSVTRADYDKVVVSGRNAFSNPSAGKRWLKEQVLANTNKKSIKMVPTDEKDIKDKPIAFNGLVSFKVDA
jgi:hypothetical protein